MSYYPTSKIRCGVRLKITRKFKGLFMKVETIAFKTEYAEKYGVECAILIQGIQLGLSINQNKDSHRKFGKIWMYNSVKDWHRTYPFMSESTIKRALSKLKECKIIEVMQLDKNPMNKTNWYTLNQSTLSTCTNALGQNEPIEEVKLNQSKQYITNNIKQTILNTEDIFNEMYEMYGKKVAKEAAFKAFRKINPDLYSVIKKNIPFFCGAHTDLKFRPNFATYLNGKRWEDHVLAEITNVNIIKNKATLNDD